MVKMLLTIGTKARDRGLALPRTHRKIRETKARDAAGVGSAPRLAPARYQLVVSRRDEERRLPPECWFG